MDTESVPSPSNVVQEQEQEEHISSPATTLHDIEDDRSDIESDSENAGASRRKYQRGGRKTSTTNERKSRMPPVPEPEREPEDDLSALGLDNPPKKPETTHNICPTCASTPSPNPEDIPPTQSPELPHRDANPFETGIKAFNIKKAQASGGRPINVRASSSKTRKEKTKKKSKKSKKKKKAESSSEEETTDEESDDEPKQKPMSIRLDLNLMVEIFLKAKIKGDVTITFL